MSKSTLYKLLSVLAAFAGMLTLGGLGNVAIKEPFYWIPFVVNLPVYVFIVKHLFDKALKHESMEG